MFSYTAKRFAGLALVALMASASPGATVSEFEGTLRSDLEAEVVEIAAAYHAAPGDDELRRAYADVLFKLGNIWEANDVIAPLATDASSQTEDLRMGARTALLTGDYERAKGLLRRLRDVAEPGSEDHNAASRGLVMVAYQTNRFSDAGGLALPEDDENETLQSLLTFMQRFDGEPYGVEWTAPEKVAELEILNDIEPPGALPMVEVEVNGEAMKLILDTGGDRLYLDEGAAARAEIREIAERTAKYAYTKGETVTEPLGVAETVTLGDVSLTNVPVIVAQWKQIVGEDRGDGVLPTQILKQFLTTVDYDSKRITFRERSPAGRSRMLETVGDVPVRMPFFLSGSHLIFAKGSLNGHAGLNFLIDSGLAASMPLIIVDETADYLGVDKVDIQGTPYYWSPLESHGLGAITHGAAQALGNVLVEDKPYWMQGFFWDALLSHQFLRHLGSWTIDFDTMSFMFPARAGTVADAEPAAPAAKRTDDTASDVARDASEDATEATPASPPAAAATQKEPAESEVDPLADYVGTYEVAPGTDLVVTASEGKLFLKAGMQDAVTLEPVKADVFEIKLARATVLFRRDAMEVVTGLVLSQHGFETPATKR
ncbi:MAG: aspartyl protease family protein [Thermoanaerobaculia bacterium]